MDRKLSSGRYRDLAGARQTRPESERLPIYGVGISKVLTCIASRGDAVHSIERLNQEEQNFRSTGHSDEDCCGDNENEEENCCANLTEMRLESFLGAHQISPPFTVGPAFRHNA